MNVVFEWAVSSVLGSPNAQAGAIDVIAIRKQDESLSCSPFHVKLGKSSKKGEKGIVKVKVNKQDVELSMKLGPAGEAFFVERSRDFRRDPSGSFPTSPRDPQDNQPFLSPRNAEDNISLPLNVADSLGDATSAKDDPITSTSTADLVSEADLEVQVPAPSSPQLSLKRTPGSNSEFTRPRSFSEGAVVLSQSQTVPSVSLEGGCDKMEMATQHAQSSPQGEGDDHHHGISMDHNHEKVMLTGSGSSSSSAPLIPLLQLPSTETADTSSEQEVRNEKIADAVPAEGEEVEPAVMTATAAEESAVSWIWRWGTLPKKTKPKSASDLESLPAAAATIPHTTVPPSTGDVLEVDEVPTVEARSTGKAAVAKGRVLNVRHRAVSLPVLRQYESSRTGRNKLTQARQQRAAGETETKADPTAPTMAVFTQLVTAIESDITPGSPLKNATAFGLGKEDVGGFSSLLAAARVDNSRFHALSLCGQYLSATGSDMESGGKVPQNAAELRQLLETHLITPHDIVQSESPVPASTEEQEGCSINNANLDTTPEGARDDTRRNICPSILASPHLVVILDDFMLPMRAAEKLLQKVCATDGDASVPLTTQDVASAGAFTIKEEQVQDVLAELEKDLDLDPDLQSESAGPRPSEVTRLPEWVGKRISRWGREFESIERKDSALNDQAISAAALAGSAVMMSTSVEESTSMEEAEAADRDRFGSTPLGHMSWQQSFSDLVQAYRVHNIHTIHSYLDLNARAHRFGDTYNEISDGDVTSYTEKWNRLQSSSSPGPGATSGSFTALLALDTHTIHRLYTSEQDLDKWAVGVGLGLCGGTHTHSACTSRVQSHDAYDEDHFASRGLSLSHENNRPLQDTSQAGSQSLHTHHRQHHADHEDHHQEQEEQEHNHLNESADYGVGEGYSFMSHSDGDGAGGGNGLLSALGSHNSLPGLQEIEVGDVDGEDEIDETNEADEVVEKSAALQNMGGDSDDKDIGGDAAASVNAVETIKYQSSPQSEQFPPPRVPSYIQQQSQQQQPLEDTNSTTDGADTDNDCLSLQDIDFEDISPEPATGDFYESDTDSYLSLSLEEGESGRHHNNNITSRRSSMRSNNAAANTSEADDANVANDNTLSSNNSNNNTSAQEIQIGRRRIRRYLYRKVLVPSAEQLSSLPLQHGVNEVEFELPGCTPLRSCLYVWPSDCRIIVTDIEGVFTHATAHNPMNSTTVWMQFLGGGGALNSRNVANKKNHFDEAIRLFRALHHQGYRILYVAQNSTNTTTAGGNSNALLSSQEYLQGIRTSTGECLPPGPIFKSPDSLIRAFGASRTDVFKAGALKGVKSLFPSSHNPYHACFCIRESDSIPFARFGFPEGRIFLVSEKGEVKSANRTCNFTFPRLTELLHQIFPHVVDSQSSGPSSTKGGSVKLTEGVQQASSHISSSNNSSNRRPALEVDATIAATTTTTTAMNITGAVADVPSPRQQAVVTPFSPTTSTINPPHQQPHHLSGTFTAPTAVFSPTSAGAGAGPITPSSALNSVKSPKSIPFSSLTCGTEDTYNDYNFWKIPPQAIEEDDFY